MGTGTGGAPDLRAGDDDRERVAQRLRRAHDEGRLTLDEFDERVAAAYGARTLGALAELTADLPPELPATPEPGPVAAPSGGGVCGASAPDRGAVRAWASASLINIVIWGVVSVAAVGPVYPWWIWVAGPWGLILLVRWLVARGRER